MMLHIVLGTGITGATRYVMGQGNDPVTKERLQLAEGQTPRAEILGGQNFGFAVDSEADLDLARRMMEWSGQPENQAGRAKKCVNDCLHVSLSWEKGQDPSREEMTEAAQSFLKSAGMENARAIFVAHHDTPHRHMHIVASRIDPTTRKTLSDFEINLKSQAWGLQWERERGQRSQNPNRQKQHRILDAIEARDGAAIVEILTERSPTFTGRELDRALSYGMPDRKELGKFKGEILAQANVIGLREQTEGPIARYTTRDILAAEMALQRNAAILADHETHGLSQERIEAAGAAHTLKPEQADALAHLTGPEGFAVLWGEAGTGKSHALNAVRAAYESEGAQVIGLSWTNKVVQQMRDDGFANAATIASELKKCEAGRGGWNNKTVLIVDEAAMISTEHLAKLTAAAGNAGAKLILAGDDKQLSSIERGGMFETLRVTHGAAILKEVQRVKDVDQRAVFGEMHQGEFLGALQLAEKAGRLHWTDRQDDTLRDMAVKYTADVLQSPDKRRFMFAFTNETVDALNDYAHAIHQGRGDLGSAHRLPTATGAKEFAAGDRIQLTGNGYGKADKDAGYVNGRVGTITAIGVEGGKPLVTVALDTAKGKEPQRIEFIVGDNADLGEFNKFKLGYAGTIHKGQGATLDQSYVCHSAHWKSSSAYVALTRHKESLEIFASRETVRGMEKAREGEARTSQNDLKAMARGLGRTENRRAATAYRIDHDAAVRAGLESIVATLADPREQKRSPDIRAAASARPRPEGFGGQARAPRPAVAPVAAPAAKKGWGAAREAFTGKGPGRTPEAAAARGTRRTLSGLADGILRALLGESPAPRRNAGPQTAEEYAQGILERSKAMQALSRVHGREIINQDQARMEEESAKKRDRDRGGGQTL